MNEWMQIHEWITERELNVNKSIAAIIESTNQMNSNYWIGLKTFIPFKFDSIWFSFIQFAALISEVKLRMN